MASNLVTIIKGNAFTVALVELKYLNNYLGEKFLSLVFNTYSQQQFFTRSGGNRPAINSFM